MKQFIQSAQSDSNYRAHKKADREWRTKYAARKQLYKEQTDSYDAAYEHWAKVLENLLIAQFQSYIDKLHTVKITVELTLRETACVSFEYQSGYGPKWRYTISLSRKGEVLSQSSCWFHLDELNPEQADDMLNSVTFIKVLMGYDWKPLLDQATSDAPAMDEYITIKDPDNDEDYKDPGYALELAVVELDDMAGSDYWVKVRVYDRWIRWIKILSVTDLGYNVEQIAKDGSFGIEYASTPPKIYREPHELRLADLYIFYPLELLSEAEILPMVEDDTLDMTDPERR